MESTKETLRRAMRARRAALDAATVRLAGRHLTVCLAGFAPYLEGAALVAYVARDKEVPTEDAVADALRRRKRVFLPVLDQNWFAEHVADRSLERDRAGWLEPRRDAPLAPEGLSGVVLVPLLAWSASGQRLGRGGGWYDRVLPRLRLPALGVAYDCQERVHVPNEPWDVRLDYVVTESRFIDCGGVLSAGRLP
jgi:5-formyltetrahydrofolate cyclo-ligase